MLWVALFFVVIGVAVYIVDKKMKAKFEDKFNPNDWDLPSSINLPEELVKTAAPQLIKSASLPLEKETLGYQKKSSVLSHEQTQIYKALRSALAGEYSLLANVNAADTLAVIETSNTLISQVAVKNLSVKQFDFVICENTQLTAVCVIMLGDSLEPLLVGACESAKLSLVRFRVQATYDVAAIRASVLQAIGIADVTERVTEKSVLDISEAEVPKENIANQEQTVVITNEEPAIGNGIDLKLCPTCSAIMLKRKAKNGVDAGKLFWICSTYPKCRGMLLVK